MSPNVKNRYPLIAGIVVILIGLLVLAAWLADFNFLMRYFPPILTMKVNTAIAFLVAGLSLVLLLIRRSPILLVQVLSATLCIIGLVNVLQYILGIDMGIDQLLIADRFSADSDFPGRMTPASSFCICLAGLSLFFLSFKRYEQLVQIMVFLMVATAALSFISYEFNISYRRYFPFLTTMAPHTFVAFIILGSGIFTAPAIRNKLLGFEWKLISGMLVILLVMLSSFYIFNKTNEDFVKSAGLVDHTREVMIETERIISHAKDVESSSRGYVITGDTSYLSRFVAASDSMRNNVANLKLLSSDYKLQQERIVRMSAFLDSQQSFHTNVRLLRASNNKQRAELEISSRRGEILMDSIRKLNMAIIIEENRLLALRKSAHQRDIQESVQVNLIFQGLVMAILVFIYLLIYRNQRARNRAERELKESEEWFATTLSSIGDGVLVTDIDCRIIFMNPVARNLCKCGQDAYGKTVESVFNIVNEKTRKVVENPIRKVLRTGQIAELENQTVLIRKDKTEIAVDDSAAPIIDDTGNITGVVLVFRDVTDQKRVEAATKYNSLLLEHISDAVISLDANNQVVSMNKEAERLFNCRLELVKGKNIGT
ncbi:MAG: CHASE3 domain-containing protein, partial [Chitinophagaceae bacterium]|nr:CHASE3 domain-containing protein [Chitinophagaceae bacterium]